MYKIINLLYIINIIKMRGKKESKMGKPISSLSLKKEQQKTK